MLRAPGQPPATRGIYPSMHRGRPWSQRQIVGFGVPEDLEVTVVGDTLTIKGETKIEHEEKRESYLRQERRYGAFSRSVFIPIPIQADKAKASYEHGVLTVTITKVANGPIGDVEGYVVVSDETSTIRIPFWARY
jgi:hypothetical protein